MESNNTQSKTIATVDNKHVETMKSEIKTKICSKCGNNDEKELDEWQEKKVHSDKVSVTYECRDRKKCKKINKKKNIIFQNLK